MTIIQIPISFLRVFFFFFLYKHFIGGKGRGKTLFLFLFCLFSFLPIRGILLWLKLITHTCIRIYFITKNMDSTQNLWLISLDSFIFRDTWQEYIGLSAKEVNVELHANLIIYDLCNALILWYKGKMFEIKAGDKWRQSI